MDDVPETVERGLSRRRLLRAGLGAAVATALAACSDESGGGPQAGEGNEPTTTLATRTQAPTGPPISLTPTPACTDGDDPTPVQTEGPFFRTSSPAKANLAADVSTGTRLLVTGSVLTTACRPVARALIDVWQTDADGVYDNQGYRLRGHLFTGDDGRYRLETIVPGLYPGRTRHIHVKVQAPNGPVLTTQLYFPGEPANARDGIYRRELEMEVTDAAGGRQGRFDFVVRT